MYNNKKYYVDKRYNFTKINDQFEINILDLPKKSGKYINVQCDYCGEIKLLQYYNYNNQLNNNIIKKYCCSKCQPLKVKQSNLLIYGVESTNQLEKIKQKKIKTCLEHYGVENPNQSKEVIIKKQETFYKNGTQKTSKQQRYIHGVINGELNYPHYTASLDIAFPEDKIYVECDFGGHLLNVKLGRMTDEEQIEKEKRRWYALYRKGWKEIRLISKKDLVPTEDILINILNYSKKHFSAGHSWIHFDFDNNCIIFKNTKIYYDFGVLFKLAKEVN